MDISFPFPIADLLSFLYVLSQEEADYAFLSRLIFSSVEATHRLAGGLIPVILRFYF